MTLLALPEIAHCPSQGISNTEEPSGEPDSNLTANKEKSIAAVSTTTELQPSSVAIKFESVNNNLDAGHVAVTSNAAVSCDSTQSSQRRRGCGNGGTLGWHSGKGLRASLRKFCAFIGPGFMISVAYSKSNWDQPHTPLLPHLFWYR